MNAQGGVSSNPASGRFLVRHQLELLRQNTSGGQGASVGDSKTMQIIGDVQGKDVILVDDMVDTAGTIAKAADIMKEAGARSVRAIASHCVMSGPASDRIEKSQIEEMLFTDSIPYNNACAKVKQLTVADMFAEAIIRVMNNQSISDQYLI